MQSLDVISINIWQIIVSLLNLVLLYLIIRKFLYNPVKKLLENRQKAIEGEYTAAEEANKQATEHKKAYEEKLSAAKHEADSIIQSAVELAASREKEIISDAKKEAEGIINKAKADAELERRKAEDSIRQEIIELGTLISEKILQREIKPEDHTKMIDSFIEGLGDNDGGTV